MRNVFILCLFSGLFCLFPGFEAAGLLSGYGGFGGGARVSQSNDYHLLESQKGFQKTSRAIQFHFDLGLLLFDTLGFGMTNSSPIPVSGRPFGNQFGFGPTIKLKLGSLRIYGQYGRGVERDFYLDPTTSKEDASSLHNIQFWSIFLGIKVKPATSKAAKTADPSIGLRFVHYWMTETKTILDQSTLGHFNNVFLSWYSSADIF